MSIGPQSAADAYEALAYRDRRRRESISSNHSLNSKSSNLDLVGKEQDRSGKGAQASGSQKPPAHEYDKVTSDGAGISTSVGNGGADMYPPQENELEEKEMFLRLVRPRVRYDVEVVTKLVVYTGELVNPLV